MTKFLVSVDDHVYEALRMEAKRRGINVQTFLRAIVIPAWFEHPDTQSHARFLNPFIQKH